MRISRCFFLSRQLFQLPHVGKLVLADCPLVEGAVAATVSAIAGSSMEEILDELQDVRELKKLS